MPTAATRLTFRCCHQGWRSWNCFKLQVSQDIIERQVTAVAEPFGTEPSLLALGYDHIGIDDGWQDCGAGVDGSFHSAAGAVLINETLFPDMLQMTRFAHQKKVHMGCYVLRDAWAYAVFSLLCALRALACALLRAVTVWPI